MSHRVLEPEIVDNVPAVVDAPASTGLSTEAKVALGIGGGILLLGGGILLLLGLLGLGIAAAFATSGNRDYCAQPNELEDLRREEEEKKAARAQHEAAQLRYRFTALCHEYERRPHFERREFIEQFAVVHRSELLGHRRRILDDYSSLQHDTALVELLNREAPDIYRRAVWKIEALALAEQLDVGLQVGGKNTERESPEQFRERKTRHEVVAVDDIVARTRAKIEAGLKVRAVLDEYPDLDPEERDRLETEAIAAISGGSRDRQSNTYPIAPAAPGLLITNPN